MGERAKDLTLSGLRPVTLITKICYTLLLHCAKGLLYLTKEHFYLSVFREKNIFYSIFILGHNAEYLANATLLPGHNSRRTTVPS